LTSVLTEDGTLGEGSWLWPEPDVPGCSSSCDQKPRIPINVVVGT